MNTFKSKGSYRLTACRIGNYNYRDQVSGMKRKLESRIQYEHDHDNGCFRDNQDFIPCTFIPIHQFKITLTRQRMDDKQLQAFKHNDPEQRQVGRQDKFAIGQIV